MNHDLQRERILGALRHLAGTRVREARLIVEAGPVYLMSIARADRVELVQEAVASAALPPAHKLSSERGKIMRELGFGKRGGGRRNWTRAHGRDLASLERIAAESVDILARVYAAEAEELELEIVEDDNEHPQNPDLIAAMRVVAKGWDEDKRRAMYTEMLNATFLVPLDEELDDGGDDPEAFISFETHPSGRPILGAFTDWSSLRLWSPRGAAYVPIHGSELFELVLEREPVSMRINPGGDVGGELYAHEVEMLVRAVHTFRRRNSN